MELRIRLETTIDANNHYEILQLNEEGYLSCTIFCDTKVPVQVASQPVSTFWQKESSKIHFSSLCQTLVHLSNYYLVSSLRIFRILRALSGLVNYLNWLIFVQGAGSQTGCKLSRTLSWELCVLHTHVHNKVYNKMIHTINEWLILASSSFLLPPSNHM